jgi:hypothetical protein
MEAEHSFSHSNCPKLGVQMENFIERNNSSRVANTAQGNMAALNHAAQTRIVL